MNFDTLVDTQTEDLVTEKTLNDNVRGALAPL